MSLVVAPCSRKAAEHAVLRWHYSHRMPRSRLVTCGAWEDGAFIGAVVFGWGANQCLSDQFGVRMTQCAELLRVALTKHVAPVSQIVAMAIRHLQRTSPGLRVVVSFADPEHGHHGGIYQAGNWLYLGRQDYTPSQEWQVPGQPRIHDRTLSDIIRSRPKLPGESRQAYVKRVIDPRMERVIPLPKHRYAYPLDRAMRRQLAKSVKPYPAAEVSMATRPASGEERQVQALPAALVMS